MFQSQAKWGQQRCATVVGNNGYPDLNVCKASKLICFNWPGLGVYVGFVVFGLLTPAVRFFRLVRSNYHRLWHKVTARHIAIRNAAIWLPVKHALKLRTTEVVFISLFGEQHFHRQCFKATVHLVHHAD